jgi:hypothetical protein
MASPLFKHPVIGFGVKLSLLLMVVFGLQLAILYNLEKPLLADRIVLAYGLNFLLALIIFWTINQYKTRFKQALGFLFMAGSLLKFIVFFLFFYPFYKADELIQTTEFLAFFVPYAVSLIAETTVSVKLLNRL